MGTVLDWSSSEHWSYNQRPCRHCGATTNLRDAAGRPAHKICVERVIAKLQRTRLRVVTPRDAHLYPDTSNPEVAC